MKIKAVDIAFKDVAPPPSKAGVHRLGVFALEDIMPVLAHNYSLSGEDPDRHAFFKMHERIVTVRSLKLRTFVHNYMKGNCNCSSPTCQLKPAYFALECAQKLGPMAKTAYLSLYGIDEKGNEVEFTHDHTLARCFGGANSLINTTVMCGPCNNLKSRMESKIHSKTLSVLSKFLEGRGEELKPVYLLERLRKNKINDDKKFPLERFDIVPLETALNAIRNKKETLKWGSVSVSAQGLRLKTFAETDTPCCAIKDCDAVGNFFAIERYKDKEFAENQGYFLNLYGKKDNQEVLFTHYHSLQPSEDGVPNELKIITVCSDCRQKNLDLDINAMGEKILLSGGTTAKESSSHGSSRKSEKIESALEKMSAHYQMSKEEFLKWCTNEAPNYKTKKYHPSISKVAKTLGITNAAARFFRKKQNELFNPFFEQSLVKTEQVAEGVEIGIVEPIMGNTEKASPFNFKTERLARQVRLLAHCRGLSWEDFSRVCALQAENITSSSRSFEKNLPLLLDMSPSQTKIALRYVAGEMNIGPFAHNAAGTPLDSRLIPLSAQAEINNLLGHDAFAEAPPPPKVPHYENFIFKRSIPTGIKGARRWAVMMELAAHALAAMEETTVEDIKKSLSSKVTHTDCHIAEAFAQKGEEACQLWANRPSRECLSFFEKTALCFGWGPLAAVLGVEKTENQCIKAMSKHLVDEVSLPWFLKEEDVEKMSVEGAVLSLGKKLK